MPFAIPPPPPRLWNKLAKLTFAALLVALAFSITYTSSATAFSDYDLRQIILFGAAVNAALLLGALLLPRPRVVDAVLSLIVLAGVGTAHVVHTDIYLGGSRVILVLLCVALYFGLFTAFRAIDDLRWGGAAFSAAAFLALAAVVVPYWAGGAGAVEGDTSNIREITFQETPNLYFVSFDSLAPISLLDKHMGLETTKFHDVFESNFHRFPNFFADLVRTTHSLNSLLSLEVDVYDSLRRELHNRGYDPNPYLFAGQNPSPLLEILRKNGYETTTAYGGFYFGKRKGVYVDNYFTYKKNAVCNLLDAEARNLAFWGYCLFFGGGFNWSNDSVVEHITKVDDSDEPQFVMAHLYTPGHTGRPFRHDNTEHLEEFKSQYSKNIEKAASYLESIIQHLEENDSSAILLVYGDHGPILSRGVEFEDNPEFIVQDKYGILGGVYPSDACAVWFDEASAQGYMTILNAVHALLRCLSGGESALVEPIEHRLGSYSSIPDNLDYKDFIYE